MHIPGAAKQMEHKQSCMRARTYQSPRDTELNLDISKWSAKDKQNAVSALNIFCVCAKFTAYLLTYLLTYLLVLRHPVYVSPYKRLTSLIHTTVCTLNDDH